MIPSRSRRPLLATTCLIAIVILFSDKRRENPNSAEDATAQAQASKHRIVCKLKDDVWEKLKVPYEDGIDFEKLGIGPWHRLVQQFPGIQVKRLFTSLKPQDIQNMMKENSARGYPPHHFLTYFEVLVPPQVDSKRVAAKLSGWEKVERAYVDLPGTNPQCPADIIETAEFKEQGYLNPAPEGIDAKFAWTKPGGCGEGQTLADFEKGWKSDHSDLPPFDIRHGREDVGDEHGTNVLGVIAALADSNGSVGIVPKVDKIKAFSYVPKPDDPCPKEDCRANALLVAINDLKEGDVLLLEVQLTDDNKKNMPVETLQAEFDLIWQATHGKGIVVVEAAGNGDTNLDCVREVVEQFGDSTFLSINRDCRNQNGSKIFDTNVRDSGAIIVGAAHSAVETSGEFHSRVAAPTTAETAKNPGRIGELGSNFGSRVDCYAWGKNVTTTKNYQTGAPISERYRNDFPYTSAAAAIIAGAALSVQGVAQAKLGRPFTGTKLREILKKHGTPSEGNEIGVMPNLRKIIEDELKVTPP